MVTEARLLAGADGLQQGQGTNASDQHSARGAAPPAAPQLRQCVMTGPEAGAGLRGCLAIFVTLPRQLSMTKPPAPGSMDPSPGLRHHGPGPGRGEESGGGGGGQEPGRHGCKTRSFAALRVKEGGPWVQEQLADLQMQRPWCFCGNLSARILLALLSHVVRILAEI